MIEYGEYVNENQLPSIVKLVGDNLSEAYSIYVYRYFIAQWPKLCFVAMDGKEVTGVIICKLEDHRGKTFRGYIAMLAIADAYRGKGIATSLVLKAIQRMTDEGSD